MPAKPVYWDLIKRIADALDYGLEPPDYGEIAAAIDRLTAQLKQVDVSLGYIK